MHQLWVSSNKQINRDDFSISAVQSSPREQQLNDSSIHHEHPAQLADCCCESTHP